MTCMEFLPEKWVKNDRCRDPVLLLWVLKLGASKWNGRSHMLCRQVVPSICRGLGGVAGGDRVLRGPVMAGFIWET